MKFFARSSFILFVLLLLVLSYGESTAAGVPSEESETVFIDLASDQKGYSRQVAELNLLQHDSEEMEIHGAGREDVPAPLTAVLCRSNGEEIDFSRWAPRYVVAGPHNCYTLYFSEEDPAETATKDLSALDTIRYAELDSVVQACEEDDKRFNSWGAETMHYGEYLDYQSQWRSGSALVAIIDSGVYLHPMLSARILESGYDYIDADADATNDLFGHGTNVAGIVADCTMDAPVYIYPIRVLNANGGGNTSNVVNAVREATEKGVTVMNLSLESRNLSQALDDAIEDALDAGITVVIAAGNSAIDTEQVSPAHLQLSGAIVVGSAESDGSRSPYSNYGTSVDVFAYGTDILCCSRTGGYTAATGTSIAAPHISALAALLRLLHPDLSPDEIENRIVLASDGDDAVNIPDLKEMIPEHLGFSLQRLVMACDETLDMPLMAVPETSHERICYTSSNESILAIEDNRLVPLQEGTVMITASCTGFPDISFEVAIEDNIGPVLSIPSGIRVIEDEAFRGNDVICRVKVPKGTKELGAWVFEDCSLLKTVALPDTLNSIAPNSFSGAVVLCPAGSEAELFARENDLFFISVK